MQRSRSYFFDTTRTTAGAKLNANNIPSEVTFRDLLDSLTFKGEVGDYATETVQGLVKLSTVSVSKARSGGGVVLPAHLPVLTYGASFTELITPGTQSYEGIKITAVSKTDRLDYQVDFDPSSLTAKTTPAALDYFVIVDSADSNKPKKVHLSALTSSEWQRIATTISPVTAGDTLDMGTGNAIAAGFNLTAAAKTYINPLSYTGNNGADLSVAGGAGQHASAAKNGGDLYLFGGSRANAGTDGNVGICWNGLSAIGHLGIGGAADSTYTVKITGSAWLTGAWKHGISVGGGGGGVSTDAPLVLDVNGVEKSPTFKQFMDSIIGATVTNKSVLWFDGTQYNVLPLGAVADKYLRVNASLNLELADLVLTNKIYDAAINASAQIAFSKMATLTASVVPVLNGSGVIVASTVGSTQLGYIANLTSDVQAQISAIVHNVITWSTISVSTVLTAATMKESHIMDTGGGGVTVRLPLISTVYDGQVVEFNQYGANPGVLAANAGDNNFVTQLGATAVTLTLSGAGGYVKLRADASLKQWVVVSWI